MPQQSLRTERDAAAAYELLSTASEDPAVLAVLTDEELTALAGAEAAALAGTPFLDESELERGAAAAIALRSLVARGLVQLTDEGRETEGEDLATGAEPRRAAQLDRTLAGLLTLRTSPLALVHLTRRVADQTTSLLLSLHPHGGVLEELITADGFHHFSLPAREAVPARLARYVDADQVAGEADGATTTATAAELDAGTTEISRRLQDARALTVVTSADGGTSSQLTVVATTDAVLAMDTPQDAGERVEVRELGTSGLEALLAAALPDPAAL
ncbi:hypothetical protein GCM10009592_00310 [Brachybacterium rhamnosum]|uniref:DNA-binding protein n=1 Tax=Brachybacterium rhamnosum TaxID=173361 RepID=A0ABW4PRN4_9MICO